MLGDTLYRNDMKKIVTIVGARPQFVKAAAVSRAIASTSVKEVIVHTGQHFDKNMSDVFFEEMEIPMPDYKLDIHSLSHGAMTGRMLEKIEEVLLYEKPDGLMVYGDTNSTLAGAIAASKLHIPVVHVEAGLRSFNMLMPEEVNRILTDRIASLLLCPTDAAIANLKKEGFDGFGAKVVKNGDVMQDAAIFYAARSEVKSKVLSLLGLSSGFVLATIHRQENTDDPEKLRSIIEGLNTINRDSRVVVPLHPRTRNIIAKQKLNVEFLVIDPVGYFDMVELLKHCSLVVTDSGGVQKEAFFFKKPCITAREQTEWVELVDNGFNTLVGSDSGLMLKAYHDMLAKSYNFDINLYGNGHAASVVANEIEHF